MRISDWSSYVCSSDLPLSPGGGERELQRIAGGMDVGQRGYSHGDTGRARGDGAKRERRDWVSSRYRSRCAVAQLSREKRRAACSAPRDRAAYWESSLSVSTTARASAAGSEGGTSRPFTPGRTLSPFPPTPAIGRASRRGRGCLDG